MRTFITRDIPSLNRLCGDTLINIQLKNKRFSYEQIALAMLKKRHLVVLYIHPTNCANREV